ncbi:MAG: UDP-2,3-diacylglucosamine diphosphatase [Acidobacteria bacterium]|nr:MAG: UDP-2,3-diacylglucosamine diphosphatase [Acidobacteriota bacterium]
MSVAVIADSHLGGPGGPAGPLIEQLDALPDQGCERLILLGDVFHVWVGFRPFETDEIRALLPALERLRRRGVTIDYVEGNRDFFLQHGPYARYFDRLAREVAVTAGGRRYLAVHGDGLNDRDYPYRFWRWLSKSWPTRLMVRSLPATLSRRLMFASEQRLGRTNFKHKTAIPEEVIRRYGERRLAEGFDVLLLGHFHAPRTLQVAGGEIRLLDAWFNSRRVEWLEGGAERGAEHSKESLSMTR